MMLMQGANIPCEMLHGCSVKHVKAKSDKTNMILRVEYSKKQQHDFQLKNKQVLGSLQFSLKLVLMISLMTCKMEIEGFM